MYPVPEVSSRWCHHSYRRTCSNKSSFNAPDGRSPHHDHTTTMEVLSPYLAHLANNMFGMAHTARRGCCSSAGEQQQLK